MMTREMQVAIGVIRRMTGQRYPNLEQALELMEPAAVHDLAKLMTRLENDSHDLQRKVQQPWRP